MPLPNYRNYLKRNCPELLKRMEQDAQKGKFRWSWWISGTNTREYMGNLAGRKIHGEEDVFDTLDEIEQKLHDANR